MEVLTFWNSLPYFSKKSKNAFVLNICINLLLTLMLHLRMKIIFVLAAYISNAHIYKIDQLEVQKHSNCSVIF